MTSTTNDRYDTCLQVFTKAPYLLPVKTRLSPALSREERKRLYMALVEHTLKTSQQLPTTTLQLWVNPRADEFLKHQAKSSGANVRIQHGRDLGDRMHHALCEGLKVAPRALLIGCDCPSISRDYLKAAEDALTTSSCVIGPATDGGYVLIGISEPLPEAIFSGIPWGTEDVLEMSLEKLKEHQISTKLLTPLSDIDTPEDLRKLPETLSYKQA